MFDRAAGVILRMHIDSLFLSLIASGILAMKSRHAVVEWIIAAILRQLTAHSSNHTLGEQYISETMHGSVSIYLENITCVGVIKLLVIIRA